MQPAVVWDHVWDDTVWDHRLGPCLGPSFGTMGVWDPPFPFGTMRCLGTHNLGPCVFGTMFGTIDVWDQLFGTIPFGTMRFGTTFGTMGVCFVWDHRLGPCTCLGP